jgi:hypothetical protein
MVWHEKSRHLPKQSEVCESKAQYHKKKTVNLIDKIYYPVFLIYMFDYHEDNFHAYLYLTIFPLCSICSCPKPIYPWWCKCSFHQFVKGNSVFFKKLLRCSPFQQVVKSLGKYNLFANTQTSHFPHPWFPKENCLFLNFRIIILKIDNIANFHEGGKEYTISINHLCQTVVRIVYNFIKTSKLDLE